ncbi:hypothetical protein JCM18899A_01710 [Nocardioides sp. AN3]
MTRTVPAVLDLRVQAPSTVVHGGCTKAQITVLPRQAIGPLDGALRLFEDGLVVAGLTAQLHDFGTVTLEIGSLPPGRHLLTAAYTGGSRYHCASAEPFEVLVLPADTVTDLVVPPVGVAAGDSLGVTVRATATSTYPSGTVALYQRARLLATGEVVDGVGTVALPSGLQRLAPGLHRLFAAYSGDATHAPSETPVVPVTVVGD